MFRYVVTDRIVRVAQKVVGVFYFISYVLLKLFFYMLFRNSVPKDIDLELVIANSEDCHQRIGRHYLIDIDKKFAYIVSPVLYDIGSDDKLIQ